MKPYYQDASVTIYHGDCREVIPTLALDDCVVITDPPYGIAHKSNHVAPTTTARWMNSAIANDGDVSVRNFVLSSFTEWICFGSHKAALPPGVRGTLVWDKGPSSGMGDLSFPWKLSWELVFVSGSRWSGHRDEGVIKGHHIVTRASMGRMHPNEKPVTLMQTLIAKHPAACVLDPFMGSGSTLVAAKNLGRTAFGIEVDERYCEIAARRCSQETLDLGAA